MTKHWRSAAGAVLLFAVASAVACSTDPERAKQEYMKSGDRFFEQKRYPEAVVQYRNALQQDPKFGAARYRLAESHEALGDALNALREYVRAADALPANAKAQWKAGTMLLLAGQFQEARARAEKALKLEPMNSDAQILLGNALAGLKDFDAAVKEIEEAIKLDPGSRAGYSSLGAIQQARGNQAEAELAFRKAAESDPKRPMVHLALANYLWSIGRLPEAEQSFRTALSLEPGNLLAHRALASYYLSTNRAPQAESHLKTLADSDTSPGARLKLSLADYYVAINRPDDALLVLEDVAANKGAYSAARTREAILDYRRKGAAEGNRVIEEVLAKDPTNVPALLTKARFLMAEGKLQLAQQKAQAAVAADAGSVQAHFLLGTIYRKQGNDVEALSSFTEVLKINPRVVAAQLQLSQLNLARGARADALQLARDAAKALPSDPNVLMTLANSLLANGDFAGAERIVKALAVRYPKSALVLVASGKIARAKRDFRGARQAFALAEAADAASYEAFAGQVSLDLLEKQPDAAKARVDRRLASLPKDPRVLMLGAQIYAGTGDLKRSEELLQLVVEADASHYDAYVMLAQLYEQQKRVPDARASLEAILAKQPNAIGPHTMIAMLYEAEGNMPEAQKRYEHVIQIDRNAAVAGNNLAYIYAENGGNLDLALQFAQVARQKLPDTDEVADTLGWVYVKKGLASLAVAPLEEAVKREPNNATYQYHLGVALARSGEKERGRQALERALNLKLEPRAAEEARKLAAEL